MNVIIDESDPIRMYRKDLAEIKDRIPLMIKKLRQFEKFSKLGDMPILKNQYNIVMEKMGVLKEDLDEYENLLFETQKKDR